MNVHFYFRSKIEPTLEKSVLYEEIATKLYFCLAGGSKSILPYWTTDYTVSQLYMDCQLSATDEKKLASKFIRDMTEERKVLNHSEWQDVLTSITTMM